MKVYVVEWYDSFGEGSSWVGKVYATIEKAEEEARKERELIIAANTSRYVPAEEAEYYSDRFHILEKEVIE